MRVLLLTTRSPFGRQTGRKTVLITIVRSLRALGHDVRVLAITDEASTDGDVAVETVAPPRPVRILVNAAIGVAAGRRSFNECLYTSRAIRRRVREVCGAWDPDVVIADMIRTAAIALDTRRKVVVDLDDLLSRRYRDLADGRADTETILGYYGSSLPRGVRAALAWAAARFVRLEAAIVERREVDVARRADAVSLVSREEADDFGRRIGRGVDWLPMAVPVPSEPAPVADNAANRLVFVGGLDYHANVEAVRWYIDEVVPALAGIGHGHLRLRVVGYCPDDVRAKLASDGVELLGYVDDLAAELAGCRAFVAPIPPGTGIKTKVLEAMAAGVPVVSTAHGVIGFGAVPGDDCLVAGDGPGFAAAIVALVDDGERAAAIAAAGRAKVSALFAPDIVRDRWRDVLDRVVTNAGRTS